MAKIKYVTLKLPEPVVTDIIDPRVSSGEYSSRTEVVKDALRKFCKIKKEA